MLFNFNNLITFKFYINYNRFPSLHNRIFNITLTIKSYMYLVNNGIKPSENTYNYTIYNNTLLIPKKAIK